MAKSQFRLYSLLLLLPTFSLLSLTFPSVSCRNLSPVAKTPKSTFLNVSFSIQKTIEVLKFNPEIKAIQNPLQEQENQQLQTTLSSSSPSFTLQLHPRASLHKSQHNDYKALTLSRFKRDSARVRSLNTKLDFAIKGVKKSDLKPLLEQDLQLQEEDESEKAIAEATAKAGDLKGPIISGTSQGSGEYFSRVGLGTPSKPLYMVLDTGSDVSWVQCAPCTDCYQQTDPIFEPSGSSTFSPLSCETSQCNSLDVSACRNGSCMYQVSYGDGSYTVGDFVTETLSFGQDLSTNTAATPVQNVAIGCGHDNEGLFVGSAGLLGLGGGALSFPSQVKATSFSYCLVDRDSSSASTLEFGSSAEQANAVTAPLLRNSQLDTFYYVGLKGLSVAGEMLSVPPTAFDMDESGSGGVIIDSGTAITRLQTEVYNSLRDAFVKGTGGLPSASGVALFDTCYDLSSKSTVEVPTVAFHFEGGKSLPLPAKNYLIPVDSVGTFCFGFAPTSSSLSIIGNVQQQGTRVSFDVGNSVVGFSANKC